MRIVCPNCNSSNKRVDSKFCSYCGFDLAENHCTNRECSVFKESEILNNDEYFCYKCGSKSTFFEEGKIIDPAKKVERTINTSNKIDILDDDLPF